MKFFMPTAKLQKFDAQLLPQTSRVDPRKLISGDPLQTLWNQYSDPSERFFSGIWQSEPGKWRIQYTEEEFCQILDGVSVVTDADGVAITLRPGDNFVIPRGFEGTWEVVETTRKIYAIYESGQPL
jgi:uncharacterized cupin superfamily protein